MLQKTNTPNPLNYFNVRRFKKKPKNLNCEKYNFESDELGEQVVKWIEQNLKSRYYFGRHLVLDGEAKFQYIFLVGFETPKEMSIFNLSCPFIHQ
jgi:hypothetical protein